MPSIEKLESGFIYKEDFTTDNIMWQFFPNLTSRYEKKNNSLVLKYGEGKVMALTKAPAENFVMQCKVKHTPLSTNSFAGVVLLKDSDDLVECESYRDPDVTAQEFYAYIKVVKIDYNYYFYGSKTGSTWIMIGAVAYTDCHLIGFFFETDTITEEFIIEEITFYKSPIISMNSISSTGYKLELRKNGTTIKSQLVNGAEVKMDLTQYLLPLTDAQLRLVTSTGAIVSTTIVPSLCGGDQFGLHHNIRLLVDGVEINHNESFDLGRIYGGAEVMLTIENLDVDFTLLDTKVSIQRFSPYDAGHENVELLLEASEEGTPYSTELIIPTLRSGEPVNVLMKVQRQSDIATLFKTHGFKYKLIIE